MTRKILRTPAFVRAAKRLAKKEPQSLAVLVDALVLLKADAFDPRLRTHKLHGELAGRWSCSEGYELRMVFEFVPHEGSEAILLLSLGTHDEVY